MDPAVRRAGATEEHLEGLTGVRVATVGNALETVACHTRTMAATTYSIRKARGPSTKAARRLGDVEAAFRGPDAYGKRMVRRKSIEGRTERRPRCRGGSPVNPSGPA